MGKRKRTADLKGSVLRKARKARGWTLNTLAKKSGVSLNHIARIERNEVGASIIVFQRLVRALEMVPKAAEAVIDWRLKK